MVNGENVSLTRKQDAALIALAFTNSVREAAEKAGVSERTLHRWMQAGPFIVAYRDQARRNSGQAHSALMDAQLEAVQVLRKALRADAVGVRIRAASRLLEVGLKVRDEDLELRLEELERKARQWQG